MDNLQVSAHPLSEVEKGRNSDALNGWISAEKARAYFNEKANNPLSHTLVTSSVSDEHEVADKLQEAEQEARSTKIRYSHEAVMTELREQITDRVPQPK